MSCIQVTVCWPRTSFISKQFRPGCLYSPSGVNYDTLKRLVSRDPFRTKCSPLKSFGGNKTFSWDSLRKRMDGFGKEPSSLQDVLRKQIQERDFVGDDDDDGGSSRGGGRGGDGGADDSGEQKDEGISGILDELLQVVLAIIGFIFVYIYMLRGPELSRLFKDYIFYLFGAKKSVRLRYAMSEWEDFRRYFKRKKRIYSKNWLERAIVNTPTLWKNSSQLIRNRRAARIG